MNNFGKVIVSMVIILNIVFTGVVLYVFYKVKSEPTVLITAWFAFTTGELWMLASIKKAKVKGSKKDENLNQ
jgi:hypothetical protein